MLAASAVAVWVGFQWNNTELCFTEQLKWILSVLATVKYFVEISLMSGVMNSNIYGIHLETFLGHLK